jgi:hypothetical protein
VRKPLAYNNDNKGTKLSHRGVQLSKELHSKFSHSTPGSALPKKMRYKDFRGYLAAVGRPGEMAEVRAAQHHVLDAHSPATTPRS